MKHAKVTIGSRRLDKGIALPARMIIFVPPLTGGGRSAAM
jgi:hypothetical protein